MCRQDPDGLGPWQLMTYVAQIPSQVVPDTLYNSHWKTPNTMWIKGYPTDNITCAEHCSQSVVIQSARWESFLQKDSWYQIMQDVSEMNAVTWEKVGGFKISYNFRFNGYITQNEAPDDLDARSWSLVNRTILENNITSNPFDFRPDSPSARFYLPIGVGASGTFLTGCNGYEYSSSGCSLSTGTRRYGIAGIVLPSSGTDVAASETLDVGTIDGKSVPVAKVRQWNYNGTEGIALRYWIREPYHVDPKFVSPVSRVVRVPGATQLAPVSAFPVTSSLGAELEWTIDTTHGGMFMINESTGVVSIVQAPPTPVGDYKIVLSVTDISESCIGECTDTASLTVSFIAISSCPSTIYVNVAEGVGSSSVTWLEPTLLEMAPATLINSHSPGDSFPVGKTTVIYQSNASGANCSFDVRVEEVTAEVSGVVVSCASVTK